MPLSSVEQASAPTPAYRFQSRRGPRTAASFILTLLVVASCHPDSATAELKWEDCGLESDSPSLLLRTYSHQPADIIADQPSNISKSWWYFGEKPLLGLSERVVIDRKLPGDQEWSPYFNNSFNVCGSGKFEHSNICPVAPNKSFSYTDHHAASHSPPAKFRAREEYFDNEGVWIGCATVVYKSL